MRQCVYCLGMFAGREDAETCSAACRKARSDARDGDLLLPFERRYTFSPERERATGWGAMSPRDSFHADIRARLAAGIDDGVLPPHGPGFGRDDIKFEEWIHKQRRAS